MSAPFAPGDVVVCVDDRDIPGTFPCGLRKGAAYRIERCSFAGDGTPVVDVGLNIENDREEFWHLARRFRKIDDERYPEVLERLKSLSKPKERV